MKQIAFQIEYIEELTQTAIKRLRDPYVHSSTIVFKAPTGSGKTYIMSKVVANIVQEQASSESYSFIWLSVNSLHEQSKQALIRYFEEFGQLECISIEDISNNVINESQIVFVNWDSLIKENNLFRMENELDWNLQTVITNTRDEGRELILIIDESHRTAKADKAIEVIEEISPKLTIEMTATPSKITGTLIEIPLARVIAEGMIKSEIQINPSCDAIGENRELLSTALKKRKTLQDAHAVLQTGINPLLLIQIPNKKQSDSTNPEDYIIGLLADQGVTERNGKLAIRLSGVNIKELDQKVKPNNSPIQVLIFKESIALGWDCPRSSILFLQREWKQERYSFNIQTLGRIMRMPEQKHYQEHPQLNIGYVYSASNNFEIVQELADDYVSELQMSRDEEIYTKPLKLSSEFIRRKRELTRLSGDFKTCLQEAAKELKIKNEINVNVGGIQKTIATEGRVQSIDKEQKIKFDSSVQVKKDIKEITDSYVNFCAESTSPYSRSRSTNIIKSSLRSLFKEEFGIADEDRVSVIVMHKHNINFFRLMLERAKEIYKNIPSKEDEIIQNNEWQIPAQISIFSSYEKLPNSKKSIMKQADEGKLFVKKNKNGKIELSKPELEFINELEETDDYVQWWFKNGIKESKYFGIAYKKEDGFHYAFYPDFVIKAKKETLIIEIKDDKDFKAENVLKLNAGRDYISRANNQEKIRFFMISPIDFPKFFMHLKEQELDSFTSVYEEKLIRINLSQKKVLESKEDKSQQDETNLRTLMELSRTLELLEDEKLKNELIQMELDVAQNNLRELSLSLSPIPEKLDEDTGLRLKVPFNICVLGEVTDFEMVNRELNVFFSKIGVTSKDWNIENINNTKLKSRKNLKYLKIGQPKYDLIVTGQIHHHSLPGNQKANIYSELNTGKYVDSIKGCEPEEKLTPKKLIIALESYLKQNYS